MLLPLRQAVGEGKQRTAIAGNGKAP